MIKDLSELSKNPTPLYDINTSLLRGKYSLPTIGEENITSYFNGLSKATNDIDGCAIKYNSKINKENSVMNVDMILKKDKD